MKRSAIGAGLLIILFALSLGVTCVMDKIHVPVAEKLEQAGDAARAGEWEAAVDLAGEAESAWKQWDFLRKCCADHGPVEEIEAQFAALTACIHTGEQADFPGIAAQTAQRVKAMGDAHGLNWGNFF